MLQQIIIDLKIFFEKYYRNAVLLSSFFSILILTGTRILGIIRKDKMQKSKCSFERAVFCFLFSFYAYMVIAITLLSRAEGSNNILNLCLFSTFGNDMQNKIFLVENVLLFLPLGIFIGHALWKKYLSMGYVVLLCMSCSFAIEITQYITGRGKFEIDDIMTNTLGGIIGYLIYRIYHRAIKNRLK